MEKMEMVEKLQEKTGISAEEAWTALEKNGWVLVDAMLWLEKEKGIPAQTGHASSASDENTYQPVTPTMGDKKTDDSLWTKIKKLLQDSMTHHLILRRHDQDLVRLPVLILLILLCVSSYIVVIGLLVAFLYGCQYSIEDISEEKSEVKGQK